MTQPRFQAFSRHAGQVEWRLIGGNNWELGRSPRPVSDLTAVRRQVQLLQRRVHDLCDDVHFAGRPAGWRWSLLLDDEVVAVASRGFLRRTTCRDTLHQFRLLAGTADLPSEVRRFV